MKNIRRGFPADFVHGDSTPLVTTSLKYYCSLNHRLQYTFSLYTLTLAVALSSTSVFQARLTVLFLVLQY